MRLAAGITQLVLALCLPITSASAQQSTFPVVARMTCSQADSVLGPPVHEEKGRLLGDYDSRRDSTYLFVYRKAESIRSFIPYTSAARPGQGPFEVGGLALGLNVMADSPALDSVGDSLAVTLVLDDFTRIRPGYLKIGKQFGGVGGVRQVGLVLTRAAALALLRSKSALVDWGWGHADLEPADIGAFRAFERTLLCAPMSLPHPQSVTATRLPPAIPRPNSTGQDDGEAPLQWALGSPITERTSCAIADSVLGVRAGENGGSLSGEYDDKSDSASLSQVFDLPNDKASPIFHTAIRLAAPGPFALDGLNFLDAHLRPTVSFQRLE